MGKRLNEELDKFENAMLRFFHLPERKKKREQKEIPGRVRFMPSGGRPITGVRNRPVHGIRFRR